MNAIKKDQEQDRRRGGMNRGFHAPTGAPVAGAGSRQTGGKRISALPESGVTIAAVGVPQAKELPGRFPGAEPYIPAASYRVRGNM